jgi:peptidoglycan/LPS O-acetylase OafA/YrhL
MQAIAARSREYPQPGISSPIAQGVAGFLAPALGAAGLVGALMVSGLYQPLVFRLSGVQPVLYPGYAIAYAAIAGALLALAVPRLAIASVLAATWTVWFLNSGALEFWKFDGLLRLASVLMLAALPMWGLRKGDPAPAAKQGYIPTLDGWRAIAILLVIADHALVQFLPRSPFLERYRFGQHGVNLFFALSGFLITTRLLNEKSQTGSISLRRFYRRRAFRILPAVLPAIALVGILACTGIVRLRVADLASSLFFFRNMVLYSQTVIVSHFWSLSLEEQFYLIVPLLIVLGTRRKMIGLCVGLAFASAMWRWYYFARHAVLQPDFMLYLRTDYRLDGLLLGCVLAYVLQNPEWNAWLRRALSSPVWWALVVAMVVLIGKNHLITTFRESLLWPLLLAGTILRPQSTIARVLEWKPLRWIGVLSYSLYVWQQIFLLSQPVPRFVWMTRFPVNLLFVAAFGCASYWLVERPALRWSRRTGAEMMHPTPPIQRWETAKQLATS